MTLGTQPFQIKLSSLLIWGLGLFWMLAMLSADFRDPTFFNPLYPAEGFTTGSVSLGRYWEGA